MEKDLDTVLLLDIYSGLLTEKQLRLCDMYYNQDYSLSEIADIEQTTRQAARDGIEKAKQKLKSFEENLGVLVKRSSTLAALEKARQLAEGSEGLTQIIDEINDIWGKSDGV